MKKKTFIRALILILLLSVVIIYIVTAAFQTTPTGLKQRLTLGTIRDCIWYGFDEKGILSQSNGEKQEIVLPESLMEYNPLVYHFNLKEREGLSEDCDWIYNPNGYKDKTWIVIYNAADLKSRLSGNYVLWSDKEIRRKRGIKEDAKTGYGFRYYSTSVSD